MATMEEMFPSRFLRADDLGGKPQTVVIMSAGTETLKSPKGGEERKTVLYFRGKRKTLPLNKTNWRSVADICGDNSDDWAGQTIEIFPTVTDLRGETVPCVRIRAPGTEAKKTAKAPSTGKAKAKPPSDDDPADDMDDEIPF
jgi:hypothetical protein